MASWHRFDRDRNVLCITLHVQPKARSTAIVGPHGDSLKVRIAAPAFEGRANALLIEFLGKKLNVPVRQIAVTRGARGRDKVVEIIAPGPSALRVIEDWDQT